MHRAGRPAHPGDDPLLAIQNGIVDPLRPGQTPGLPDKRLKRIAGHLPQAHTGAPQKERPVRRADGLRAATANDHRLGSAGIARELVRLHRPQRDHQRARRSQPPVDLHRNAVDLPDRLGLIRLVIGHLVAGEDRLAQLLALLLGRAGPVHPRRAEEEHPLQGEARRLQVGQGALGQRLVGAAPCDIREDDNRLLRLADQRLKPRRRSQRGQSLRIEGRPVRDIHRPAYRRSGGQRAPAKRDSVTAFGHGRNTLSRRPIRASIVATGVAQSRRRYRPASTGLAWA